MLPENTLLSRIKKDISATLLRLKINGVTAIKTDQIIDELVNNDIHISYDELVEILKGVNSVESVNKSEIKLSNTDNSDNSHNVDNRNDEISKRSVDNMAKIAAKNSIDESLETNNVDNVYEYSSKAINAVEEYLDTGNNEHLETAKVYIEAMKIINIINKSPDVNKVISDTIDYINKKLD